jgi:hypothetical protein
MRQARTRNSALMTDTQVSQPYGMKAEPGACRTRTRTMSVTPISRKAAATSSGGAHQLSVSSWLRISSSFAVKRVANSPGAGW